MNVATVRRNTTWRGYREYRKLDDGTEVWSQEKRIGPVRVRHIRVPTRNTVVVLGLDGLHTGFQFTLRRGDRTPA